MEQERAAVAKQWHGKHISMETDSHTTIEDTTASHEEKAELLLQ
jgi:hypothetical protein